jgi:hypothetical protein
VLAPKNMTLCFLDPPGIGALLQSDLTNQIVAHDLPNLQHAREPQISDFRITVRALGFSLLAHCALL